MSGIFEELEMFDEGDRVVTRQAIAAAARRFENNFGGFLRQASTEREFESRLLLISADIDNMVADVVNEYGGDAEKIAAAIKATVESTHVAKEEMVEDPCEHCKGDGCQHCKKISSEHTPADEPCQNCGGHGCEHCDDDPDGSHPEDHEPFIDKYEMPSIGDDWDHYGSKKRPEHLKAQDEEQDAAQHSKVPPWLKKQDEDEDQEDGGNLRNKEAAAEVCDKCECDPCECDKHEDKTAAIEDSQPMADAKPLAVEGDGHGGNIDEQLAKAPSGIGVGAKEGAAHKVEEKDNKFYVIEDGEGEVAGPFDTQEDAYARANKLNDLENLEKEGGIKQADRPGEPSRIMPDARCTACGGNGFTSIGPGAAIQERCKECKGFGTKNVIIQEDEGRSENNPNPDTREQGRYPYPGIGEIGPMLQEKFKNKDWQRANKTTAMAKALALKEAAAQGKKREFFAAKPETGDKTEERESLPTGNEDAHDGPSPKMDKTKWKPNATNPEGNLKPIETEGENSPVPTRKMDIKQKPDYQKDTLENLKEYDNNVWEREQLPSSDNDDSSGFETTKNIQGHPDKAADTWSDASTEANPVTNISLPDALATKTAAWWDSNSAFRNWLEENKIHIKPEDWANQEELVNNPLIETLWNEFTTEGGDESMEAPIEEVIEPASEPIEEIIEKGDQPEDRVEVIHEEESPEELLDEEIDEDIDELEFEEEEWGRDSLEEEDLDRLLREEEERDEYDDEDLFL